MWLGDSTPRLSLFFWDLIIHTEKSVANNKNQFWFVGGGAREN